MATGILLFSCQKNNSQEELLKKAEDSLVTGKPDVALNLLASIQNPEKMGKDDYMQYVVIYVGAKYETKADINSDTLIIEAQRYFNKKKNSEYTPLSNYYAAQLYDESGNFPKALESYMYTVYGAKESKNDLLVGKSFNNIGYIYFEQELLDSAIINYQKALLHYDKAENTNERKLRTLTNIGRSYEDHNKLDSAYYYFNKALNKATALRNDKDISYSLQNLGVVCYGMGEYDKAINYFQSILKIDDIDEVRTQKAHLYLLNIYNKKQDNKLAKQYADFVILDLPNVTYKYTIKEIYGALAEYYKQSGDYKQALAYSELEKTTKEQIEKESNAPALLSADKNFHLTQKDREIQQFRSDIYLLLVVGGVIICVILVFIFFVWNDNKRGKAEIRECAERYDEIKALLFAMGDKYPKIEAEIKSMLEND